MSNFRQLWNEISRWQERQFGSAESRGPLGPLRHLAKEAKEAADEAESLRGLEVKSSGRLRTEIADCMFMVIEAAWRSGMSLDELILRCGEKLAENRERKWPPPSADRPVEHLREDE